MCLIIGLGNPSKQYERTRHNVGFLVLDELAALTDGKFKNKKNLLGALAEVQINNREVELFKPSTFMNLSGEAVKRIVRFRRVPQNKITVIFDDANLPLGAVRIRESGSAGGHKGMKSIIEKMKTENIRRIRLGIGRPEDSKEPLDKWLLKKWSGKEWKIIVAAAREVAQNIYNGKIAVS